MTIRARRLMVDQIALDHGLAIAVAVDRPSENLRRVQGRGRGQRHARGVEVVEHAAVLGEVVVEVAERDVRPRASQHRARSRDGPRPR